MDSFIVLFITNGIRNSIQTLAKEILLISNSFTIFARMNNIGYNYAN